MRTAGAFCHTSDRCIYLMDACIRRMPDGRSLSCGRLHTMGKAGREAHGCGEGGNENDTGIMQSGKKILWSPACH